MADNIIDFDGFEKYGPALGSYWNFVGNFLQFANNLTPFPSQSFLEEWNSIGWGGNSPSIGLCTAVTGSGIGLCFSPGFGNPLSVQRVFPTNYPRMIIGFAFTSNLSFLSGIYLSDGNTAQCFIGVDTGGRVVFNAPDNNHIFISKPLISANTRHYIEIDVAIHNTAGLYSIWLDGVLLGSATNINTRGGTSNNYVSNMSLTNGIACFCMFDDMYWRDNTGGTALPFGDLVIMPQPVVSDTQVQFGTTTSTVGPWVPQQANNVTTINANNIALVPVTPVANMTIQSIGALPRSTILAGKFKGVIYSDSSGIPGTLLSSGTEIAGCVTGNNLTLPLVTPQALTAGTQYWIGIIMDTATNFQLADINTGRTLLKLNTYSGGAPAGPITGMSAQQTFSFWGVCTSVAASYVGVSGNPSQSASVMLAGNSSMTASNEDLFAVHPTTGVTSPVIQSVKVSVNAQRQPGGVRTMDIRLKSGATDAAGSNSGIIPTTSPGWTSTRFDTDPATGSAWTLAGANAASIGYKVAT